MNKNYNILVEALNSENYESYLKTLDNQDEHELFLEIIRNMYNNNVFDTIPSREKKLITEILGKYFKLHNKVKIYVPRD